MISSDMLSLFKKLRNRLVAEIPKAEDTQETEVRGSPASWKYEGDSEFPGSRGRSGLCIFSISLFRLVEV